MMSDTRPSETLSDWQPCDGGEVQQLAWHAQSRQRTQTLLRGAAAFAGLVLFTLLAGWAWQQFHSRDANLPGGLSCAEAGAQLRDLAAGSIVDADLIERLETHLKNCAHCRETYRQLRQQSSGLPQLAPVSVITWANAPTAGRP